MKIAIQLLDRTLAVKEGGARAFRLGNGAEHPYDSVQDAVRIAVAAILRDLNVLNGSGEPDFDRFPKIVESGQIELELHGHEREAYVAALHLWAAYGVPTASAAWCPAGSRAARLVKADNGSCFYDTYRFESDVAPIERLAERAAEWKGLVATVEEKAGGADDVYVKVLKELGAKPGQDAGHRPKHIRIGVLGVTGAGKSSFINALLQRYVAPSSNAICSAVVVEFVEAESRAKEGFEVVFLPPTARAAKMRDVTAEYQAAEKRAQKLVQMSHSAQEENEAVAQRLRELLAGLKAAEARVKDAEGRLLPLSALPPFVSLVRGDYMNQLVASVKVRLAHPLLKHVVLVDTPGLRDPDDQRRRIALDELTKLDGWLYLSEGNTKFNVSVAADLGEIREQAHHDVGAIVLTKVDHIGSKGGTLQDDAVSGLDVFMVPPVSWKGRSFWCAARAPAMAAERLLAKQDGEAWATLHSEFEKHGVLNHVGRMGDPCTFKPTFKFKPARRLMDLLEVASQEPPDVKLQRGLLDYFLDASFVPAAARGLASVVNEQAIIARVSRGREMLLADIRSRVEGSQRSLKVSEQHLESIGSIEKMQNELVQIQKERSSLAQRESRLQAAVEDLKRIAADRRKARVDALEEKADELRPKMLTELRKSVTQSASWEMSGSRTYSIFDAFDAKLAAWCSKQIGKFRNELGEACAECDFEKHHVLEATRGDEARYTLHRQSSDDDQIEDHEKFFESFDTTIERMQQQAERKSRKVEKAIANTFRDKLKSVASSICNAAEEPLRSIGREIKETEKNAAAVEADIEKLKKGIPGSRDLLKMRISKLKVSIERMLDFEKALAAEPISDSTARTGHPKAWQPHLHRPSTTWEG